MAKASGEDVLAALQGCETIVFCPDAQTEAEIETANDGLAALLENLPKSVARILLLSRVDVEKPEDTGFNFGALFKGNKGTWENIERTFDRSSAVRTRQSSSAQPLRNIIVRAGKVPPAVMEERKVARCIPRVPEYSTGSVTSCGGAAEALLEAMRLDVDSNFFMAEEPVKGNAFLTFATDWKELLLPFIGPELFRVNVSNRERAVEFAQEFAAFMKEKDGMEIRSTPNGVITKFRLQFAPESVTFEDLDFGGVEFIVDTPPWGGSRLRLVRCAVSKRGGYTNDGPLLMRFKEALKKNGAL